MYGGMLDDGNHPEIETKLKEGDYVRSAFKKSAYEKEIMPNWSDKVVQIDRIDRRARPVRYKLRTQDGRKFRETFYKEQLQKVRKKAATLLNIEKVIQKKRQADGTFLCLVKYVGQPGREWIHENELI